MDRRGPSNFVLASEGALRALMWAQRRADRLSPGYETIFDKPIEDLNEALTDYRCNEIELTTEKCMPLKPVIMDCMILARKMRHALAEDYDAAYRALQDRLYAVLLHGRQELETWHGPADTPQHGPEGISVPGMPGTVYRRTHLGLKENENPDPSTGA